MKTAYVNVYASMSVYIVVDDVYIGTKGIQTFVNNVNTNMT